MIRTKSILIPIGMLLLIYVYTKDPSKGPILPCVFYEVTGLYCPGCGMTRATNAILHFKFLEAIGYNLLPLILAPFFLFYFFLNWRKKKAEHLVYWMLAISLLFAVLRNLSFFSFLAPN